MKKIIIVLYVLCGFAIAAEPPPPFVNETELQLVKTGGNSKSESSSLKQLLEFNQGANKEVAKGRYVQSKTGKVETGKAWDASLRYERSLSSNWSLFAQQSAESDLFAGYTQRDSSDLGAKYYFLQSKENTLLLEVGARYTSTNFTTKSTENDTSARVYSEWSGQINENVTGKFWVEYLPNSKNSDAYLVNYEPSLTVMMNKTFSLKTSYLVKYHNKKSVPNERQEDTTFTTALVAKF